ncbi:MAG: PAS domain S-box protein [Candidatus Fermentibacteraceae bacterium]
MQNGVSGWVRIACSKLTGSFSVTGDCLGILGTPVETLSAAADARPLLPSVVRRALEDPSVPFREDRQAGVIVTTTESSSEVVMVVAVIREEIDSVYPDLPAGVISIDHSGIVRHCNRAMGEMFGIDSTGSIGSEVSRTLPQPVLYSWSSVIKSVMMGHQVKVEFLPVAGRKNSGMLVRGGAGIVGLFHDITEALETEKRLRAVQKMNQAIFSASEAGILMFDAKGRILLANRAMARITGMSNSLVGMHVVEIFPDECLKWVDRSSKKLLARPGKGATSGDMEWINSSGEIRVVRLSLQSITDDSGIVTHVMGYVDDITDQVQGMKRLETLGRSLDYMGRLTALLPGSGRQDSGSAGLIREILEAEALAVYINDPFSGLILSEGDGAWPDGLPPGDYSELRLAPFSGYEEGFRMLTGDRLGVLKGLFARGLVYTLGGADNPMGYIVAAYRTDQTAMHREASVGELAAALLTSGLLLHREHSESEKLAYLLRGRDRFLEDLFLKLPLPAFLFSESGEVLLWNDDMTLMAGEDVISQTVQRQQRCLDRMLVGAGSLSDVLRRFSRGESIIQHSFTPVTGERKAGYMLQLRKVRSFGRGTDESCFLAAVLPEDGSRPEACASSRLLGSLIDVYEGSEPEKVMRRAALGAMKLSGADAVRLTVDRVGQVQIPQDDWNADADWESEVTLEGDRLVFQFRGGGRTSHIEVLGKSLLRILGRMNSVLSPTALEKITGVPGGLLMVTDPHGKVLFSNWPRIVFGDRSFATIDGLLGEAPPWDVLATLRAVGKCLWQHSSVGPVRGIALSGDTLARTLWYPDSDSENTESGEDKIRLSLVLVEFLLSYVRRARSSMEAMKEMLEGRDALGKLSNTLILDHGSAQDVLEVLRITMGAVSAKARAMTVEECLHIASGFLRSSGVRVPDMTLPDLLPHVFVDPEWTGRIMARLLRMAGNRDGVIALGTDDRWVTIDLPVFLESEDIPGPDETANCLMESFMDQRVEAGILAALLERHGCILDLHTSRALRLRFPVVE